MPALVTSEQVEVILRTALTAEGYWLSERRAFGETGTDIIATRVGESIHIEAIAFKSSPPARAKDFYEAFFRSISRIEVGATQCVIALPVRFRAGLPQRGAAIGAAWQRIGDAFPELQIWLVDTGTGQIERTQWNDWRNSC